MTNNFLVKQYISDKKMKIRHNYLSEQFSNPKKIFSLINKTVKFNDFTLGRYVDLFENDSTLHLVTGVEEFIQFCYVQKQTLVLASSSAMVNIERVFSRFHLHQYFTAKISGADLTASKPHPEIFEKAAILGSTSKENCIVIEDSDNGIKAANDAGIFVIGYRNPFSADQTLKNADLIIEDFSELKKLLHFS